MCVWVRGGNLGPNLPILPNTFPALIAQSFFSPGINRDTKKQRHGETETRRNRDTKKQRHAKPTQVPLLHKPAMQRNLRQGIMPAVLL